MFVKNSSVGQERVAEKVGAQKVDIYRFLGSQIS